MSKKQWVSLAVLIVVLGAGSWYFKSRGVEENGGTTGPFDWSQFFNSSTGSTTEASTFGASVKYNPLNLSIAQDLSKDFAVGNISNLQEIAQAYGFMFSADELNALQNHKFVVKSLQDTNIRPSYSENGRELAGLYGAVSGGDFKSREQKNAMLYTTDVFFTTFNNLYTELLKEMENETFYPNVKALSEKFYNDAGAHLAAATDDADKKAWMKVRNYFAVADALFSTAAGTLTSQDYFNTDGSMKEPATVMSDWNATDAKVDTYDNAAKFVKDLHLDTESESMVLADLGTIFKAEGRSLPKTFEEEYKAYAEQTQVEFLVDFTQFTPRGTYTSSSLRREYFRGMKWYIMLPFFVKSPELTTYAFDISQLMAENPEALKNYNQLESAINFLVGNSDDLMPVDYLAALQSAKGAADESAAAMDYLKTARSPKIKDLAAIYPEVGQVQSEDVLLNTKGMRFFSGKFMLDSYWTGFLTQGDEAPRPGFTQKLPPMASALEVMTLLGSDYAKAHIPEMDFYNDSNKEAITHGLDILAAQQELMADLDWQKNIASGWLWTINGLFDWQQDHLSELPQFMHSDAWAAKTLMAANAFWAQLRHATILYAKQSFAESGAGPPACDGRLVPPPAKGYIEPNAEALHRLTFLAKRLEQGLKDQGFALNNMDALTNFVTLMDTVESYVAKELRNATFSESIGSHQETDDYGTTCTVYTMESSDWEVLRQEIVNGLRASQPASVEGPILSAKDRRQAIIADVHTGGDSQHPIEILYEATGVPYVIFTAVSDVNGPRLTVGFTTSHYEFTEAYGGQRETDEKWQQHFYTGDDPYDAYQYTDDATWPKENRWYEALFDLSK